MEYRLEYLEYELTCSSAAEKIVQKAPHIINARKEDGFSALHLAACNKHLEVAKVLVKVSLGIDWYYVHLSIIVW